MGGSRADEVLAALLERGQSVAAAESLTGGLVAAELTTAPGASRAVRGSVTAYATEVKCDVLGVDEGLLAQRGAVDGEVARQMARGVRTLLRADWGLATTGVAGPERQDGKDVGTVFVAVAGPGGSSSVQELSLNGDRVGIRAESVRAVLALLLRELAGNAGAKDTEQNGGN
ncbi:damage-inducible protein CinA [Streptomyces cinnamoneus]|uniref:Damage-inducible protein CinA n=1 Tax=Streptomyces cinnamoneus TaxID=53446 RepID=A0A2G1XAQ8_STRCJ|nr:nicotinamide-nucleotide amidohydrolase family protein [Streptomyces cinnamoneus]PHQ48324.1 damage-inducible protein CinA [Streptomyces cinnamoneus]PPT16748.1 damage-inducible protein CinA [Streptomyces cinnamoneus]